VGERGLILTMGPWERERIHRKEVVPWDNNTESEGGCGIGDEGRGLHVQHL
jgi:hypothetical protein